MGEDYLTDNDIVATPKPTEINRPDYIGIVSGAQYKLENADGVTEFALVIVQDSEAALYEMSDDDLRYLSKQINGLVTK